MDDQSINQSRKKSKKKKQRRNRSTHSIGAILTEATEIINGDRLKSYGDPYESFQRVSEGCRIIWGISVPPADLVKILITLKQVRESYKHKKDNLRDWSGYTGILQELLECEGI